MKNKVLLVYILPLLLLSVSQVQAASWSNQGNKNARQTDRESLGAVKESLRDTALAEKEALRTKLQAGELDVMQKIGNLHAIRLEKRFQFYYTRLQKIYNRLGSAITDAETKYGADKLTAAKTSWTQAGTKLEDAKKAGEKAIADFKAIKGTDLSSQRKEVFAARDEAKQALSLFKDATKLMKNAAKELRTVAKTNRPSPSPKASKSPEASDNDLGVGRKNRLKISPVPVVPPPAN